MIGTLLAEIFEPRSPRGYVGRHRAPRHMRYVAAVPVQSAAPAAEASSQPA